jgi:hypothetical protein
MSIADWLGFSICILPIVVKATLLLVFFYYGVLLAGENILRIIRCSSNLILSITICGLAIDTGYFSS